MKGSYSVQKHLVRHRSTLDSAILKPSAFDEPLCWDVINFGPFYVPATGDNIALTPRNFKLYRKLIVYETGAVVRMEDSSVFIGDTLRRSYTFHNNWYFMAGDKVINSQDSRYIGLIPEVYIIGRAAMVRTSKNRGTGKRRWNRMFKRIRQP
jgi:signal peptidase I